MTLSKNREEWKEIYKAIFCPDESKIDSLIEKINLNTTSVTNEYVRGTLSSLKTDPQGKLITHLIFAILFGDTEKCKNLIREKIDVNSGSIHGTGPLCFALTLKHYDISKLLIESGANVHQLDAEGNAPMYYAITEDSPVSIIQDFFEAGFPKDGVICLKLKERPLTKAIRAKNVPVVKFLLEQSVDVNYCTLDGVTPLYLAVDRSWSSDITKLLIDHGASIEGLFGKDPPPLYVASQLADTSILKILLEAGVNVNRVFTPNKYTDRVTLPLPYVTAFNFSATTLNIKATKLLFEYGANINAKDQSNQSTALHSVCGFSLNSLTNRQKINLRETVRFLLENGADVNASDMNGNLPIYYILLSHNWIALDEYIKFGAYTREGLPNKIFCIVIVNEVINLVKLCLDFGANSFGTINGVPMYYLATKSDSPEIIRAFWKSNYPFDAYDGIIQEESRKLFPLMQNQFMLYVGIEQGNYDLAKVALQNGAEAKCCSLKIRYPLHYCSVRGYSSIIKLLLENGVPASSLSDEGWTPLHEAAAVGNLEICKLLLRHGACFNYRGPKGVSPQLLAQMGGVRNVSFLLKNISFIFTLLKRNARKVIGKLEKMRDSEDFYVYTNCVNSRGNTLLGEAIRLNLKDVAERIISFRLKTI